MSPVNYRLQLPTQWSIHDVFHTDLLIPYREMPTHGANYQCPPPDLIDGVEEFKVEKVLDLRRHRRGCKLQYLIKWKGYVTFGLLTTVRLLYDGSEWSHGAAD